MLLELIQCISHATIKLHSTTNSWKVKILTKKDGYCKQRQKLSHKKNCIKRIIIKVSKKLKRLISQDKEFW